MREQNYQYALTQGGTTLTKTTSKLSLSHKTMFFFSLKWSYFLSLPFTSNSGGVVLLVFTFFTFYIYWVKKRFIMGVSK